MRIPANLIFAWPSTIASIPSLWSRETGLDGLYPKAWGVVDPNNTGGAATHNHASPAHQHTVSAHTHSYNLDSVANEQSADKTATNSGSDLLSGTSHSHQSNTSGAANGNTSSDGFNWGASSNDPPFHQLIFIKAQAGAYFENDIIGFWAGIDSVVDIPANWQECNGLGGSPDLGDKFIKGADTGANAGTTGGDLSDTHAIDHNHASGAHSHDAAASSFPTHSGSFRSQSGGGSNAANYQHSHNVALGSVATTVNAHSSNVTPADVVQPAFYKICAIQMKTGAVVVRGLIGLWLGAIDVASLPRGWVLCNGSNGTPDLRDKYIKIAQDNTEIGDTGGANSHTHGAQSHTHTSAAHNHTGSVAGANEVAGNVASSSHGYEPANHPSNHAISSVSSETPSWQAANVTANSSSNEPQYRTVAYLMLNKIYARKALLML